MRSLPAFTTIALSSVVAGAAVIDQLSAASLVITRTPLLPSLPECLISSYLGAFGGSTGQEHIYRPDTTCAASTGAFDDLDAVTLIPLPSGEDGRVLWVGQAGVGPTWKESDGYDDLMKSWETTSSRAWKLISGVDQAQDVFSQAGTEVILHHTEPIMLLHTSNSSLLLHVPGSFLPIIDTLLPPHLVPVAFPAITSGGAGFEAVPSHLTKHLLDLTAKLQFSPQIDRIITEGIVLDDIRRHVRWLTGEAPSGIVSRHSFTPGAIKTAHWLKSKVEVTGAACSLEPFLYGFAPNVICHYPSLQNSSERIILSSHYDSRGSFGIPRAPGGNDDGSGSGHLLGVAEAIGSQGVEFEKQVTLVFFSGEEQGLLGSHAYAVPRGNAAGSSRIASSPTFPKIELTRLRSGTPEAGYLVGNISQIYSPELLVGRTPVCCFDHQSFVPFGFPATNLFEHNGPILDPMYHDVGDVSQRENYDFGQIVSIAKVTMATVLTVAGYRIAE